MTDEKHIQYRTSDPYMLIGHVVRAEIGQHFVRLHYDEGIICEIVTLDGFEDIPIRVLKDTVEQER